MTSSAIPVLWLCGPPGVGKSTVGWERFSELDPVGVAAGYVDTDGRAIEDVARDTRSRAGDWPHGVKRR